jgi:(p)ppGpp synthase/HD superfamily hydrolase
VRATAEPASVGRAAIVAVLHDSVEDTVLTVAVIENICGRDIGDAVNELTRRKDENYLTDYIPRVAASGELARIVKLADLDDHLDPAQAATLKPEKKHRYETAREILTAAPAQAAHQHRVFSSLSVCN